MSNGFPTSRWKIYNPRSPPQVTLPWGIIIIQQKVGIIFVNVSISTFQRFPFLIRKSRMKEKHFKISVMKWSWVAHIEINLISFLTGFVYYSFHSSSFVASAVSLYREKEVVLQPPYFSLNFYIIMSSLCPSHICKWLFFKICRNNLRRPNWT